MGYQKQGFTDDETLFAHQLELMEEGIIEAQQKLDSVSDAVLYTPQTLSYEQKAQARENIGAASAEEVAQIVESANAAFEGVGNALENLGEAVTEIQKVAVSVDLSQFESGVITETYADGSTLTYTMEFDADGNPIKITDSNGNITVLTW